MKSKVILVPCQEYDLEMVYAALREGLELLGGISAFVKKEESVLMKLNLVRDAVPERAVTVHPVVVEALARILQEDGYRNVKAGDSPGFGSGKKIMDRIGIAKALEKYNAETVPFEKGREVDFADGIHAKHFVIAEDVLNSDALISVSKMKTHALEHLTGAVKNQYGCVYGTNKAKGHTMYPSAESMARMIVDLNRFIKPRLYIMDGIVAMEGNGPTSGDPVAMNMLLLSDDPVALDTVFASLVNLNPGYVPTNAAGAQMGLGIMDPDKIEVVTPAGSMTCLEAFRKYGNPSYKIIREKGRSEGIMSFITKLKVFAPKPGIENEKCHKCGVCVESCPVEGKALNFTKGRSNPPVYNYKKCIRCFCCQEMCPYKAIVVK